MMEQLQVQKNENDYINVLEVAEDKVEECVCSKCGVSYFRVVKGYNQSKSFCKKCFYENRKKKNEKMSYTVKDGVATFTTTNGDTFYVDEEDAEMVSQYRWCINGCGYVIARVDGKLVRLHRLIMGVLDSQDNLVCDHINGSKILNCKSNLRICSQQQNSRNTNAKGYTKTRNGTYQAYIYLNGKYVNLGCYDTEEQAKAVRIMAEKQYFGNYSSKTDLFDDAELLALYEEAMASIEYLHKNKARIDGDVVYVTVSGKGITKEFIINVDDYEKIKDYKWIMHDRKIEARTDGENQSLTRVLLGLTKGDRTKRVTFIDKNNLNFRRENLKVIECKTKKNQ